MWLSVIDVFYLNHSEVEERRYCDWVTSERIMWISLTWKYVRPDKYNVGMIWSVVPIVRSNSNLWYECLK